MRLPTIIELIDMSETTHQKISKVDIDEAIFQPFPSEIIFQNFKPFETYQVNSHTKYLKSWLIFNYIMVQIPLQLRNNDHVPRLIKVSADSSPYFSIIAPDDVSKKVAPGMSTFFTIQFKPDAVKDYAHELVCKSEREKFLIPIRLVFKLMHRWRCQPMKEV